MKCFWSISILIILLTAGCASIKPGNLTPAVQPFQVPVLNGVTGGSYPSFFLPPDTAWLFKASMDIKKHHLTGLFLVKRAPVRYHKGTTQPGPDPGIENNAYRVVFVNELGITYFDLEVKPDSFRVVSCFEALNKKALFSILETDFRILTFPGQVTFREEFRQTGTNNRVISEKAGRYHIWQTFSTSGDTIYSTGGRSNMFDLVNISYHGYHDGFPSKINLENPVIGMRISLKLLKR